jgi:hypothetical protein
MDTDHGNVIMVQVARPLWYLYDGLEAPLGTFLFNSYPVWRMMPPGYVDSKLLMVSVRMWISGSRVSIPSGRGRKPGSTGTPISDGYY